ncbi:unnamed protein product [Pleuronectes platessa]|uniref:Uncharacterized protein n=1 Tax=Pleuronectes platessa TaxID=8262 RepID=A0A9N7W1N7_PLEPL|nr:unnamed protein product [Pleuronectes platessa]
MKRCREVGGVKQRRSGLEKVQRCGAITPPPMRAAPDEGCPPSPRFDPAALHLFTLHNVLSLFQDPSVPPSCRTLVSELSSCFLIQNPIEWPQADVRLIRVQMWSCRRSVGSLRSRRRF